MSSCSQPRARASSMYTGRYSSGPGRAGACLFRPICTSAAMGIDSYNAGAQVGKIPITPGLRRNQQTSAILCGTFAERAAMSDAIDHRPPTPSPAEGAAQPPPAGGADPLSGDWSEGLRAAARPLGIPEPKLLAVQVLPPPAPAPARAV